MSDDIIDASMLRARALERLAALKDVIAMFPDEETRPIVTDLIAMADYIATGTVDVAQGNSRVTHQLYENRRFTDE